MNALSLQDPHKFIMLRDVVSQRLLKQAEFLAGSIILCVAISNANFVSLGKSESSFKTGQSTFSIEGKV